MNKRWMIALATAGLLISACVPSLHPLHSEDTVVTDKQLRGTYLDGDSRWTFEAGGDDDYTLRIQDDGKEGVFQAHLLELDGQRYLDLYPMEMDEAMEEFYAHHLIATHTFYKVRSVSPSLEIASLRFKWLEETLKEQPSLLDHEVLDDGILLTASTEELQAFLKHHNQDGVVFDEYSHLPREADD